MRLLVQYETEKRATGSEPLRQTIDRILQANLKRDR
jgi:hypothetical protein